METGDGKSMDKMEEVDQEKEYIKARREVVSSQTTKGRKRRRRRSSQKNGRRVQRKNKKDEEDSVDIVESGERAIELDRIRIEEIHGRRKEELKVEKRFDGRRRKEHKLRGGLGRRGWVEQERKTKAEEDKEVY